MAHHTANFQNLYYHLASLETRRTLSLFKSYLPKEQFVELETYLDAAEFGIVVEALIEWSAYNNAGISEEARVQLSILAEVMKIDYANEKFAQPVGP